MIDIFATLAITLGIMNLTVLIPFLKLIITEKK